jgi:hypothetical protein
MTGTRHNPNMELVAQGVANLASPLFGGLPATGAIARTATNIRSGGKTPVAGMIHAATLLAVVLFAAPLAAHIPLAVLAAILFVVAYNMGDWGEVRQLLKLTKADIVVWTATFTLTVVADLTVAVEVGMIGRAAVHPARGRDHVGGARHRRWSRRGGAYPAGQGDPGLRGGLPDPRTVPVRHHRQDRADSRRHRSAAAIDHPPAARARDRRLGPAGARTRRPLQESGRTPLLCGRATSRRA